MTDAARILIEDGAKAVSREDWLCFCAENGLTHCPGVLGGQVFHSDGIRASFAPPGGNVYRARLRAEDTIPLREDSRELVFSTYPGSPRLDRVAALARSAQIRFGGRIEAEGSISGHLGA